MVTFGSCIISSRLLLLQLVVVILVALASSGAHAGPAGPVVGNLGGLLGDEFPLQGGLLSGLLGGPLPAEGGGLLDGLLSTNPADSALPDVPVVFPAVAAGKLETRNMLAFCIKVNLDSPATQEEPERTVTILPGQKGDVPIMAADPTGTKSMYRISVYYDPPTPAGTCKGRYTVFATNGPPSARVVAAVGYRAVLPGFCTGGDAKEITGLIVHGSQGTDTNVGTQYFECAKKIASGEDP